MSEELKVVVTTRIPPHDVPREGPVEQWFEIEAHVETWGGSYVDTHHAVICEAQGRRKYFCPNCERRIFAARHKRVGAGGVLKLTHGGVSDIFSCRNCRLRITIPRNARIGPLREFQAA